MTKVKPKQVVIDRATWRFGGDVSMTGDSIDAKFGRTKLLNDKGFKCCLGFACGQLYGVPENKLRNQIGPAEVIKKTEWEDTVFSKKISENETFDSCAIGINDGFIFARKDRESDLISLFADVGIKLSFTGRYPKGAPK